MSRAVLRSKSQITLPPDVRTALHLAEGDGIEFTVEADGQVTLSGTKSIPADQAWFWTLEWQEGERMASEQIASGDVRRFESSEELLDFLAG